VLHELCKSDTPSHSATLGHFSSREWFKETFMRMGKLLAARDGGVVVRAWVSDFSRVGVHVV
jgi:hypothetical protein